MLRQGRDRKQETEQKAIRESSVCQIINPMERRKLSRWKTWKRKHCLWLSSGATNIRRCQEIQFGHLHPGSVGTGSVWTLQVKKKNLPDTIWCKQATIHNGINPLSSISAPSCLSPTRTNAAERSCVLTEEREALHAGRMNSAAEKPYIYMHWRLELLKCYVI